MTDRAPDAPRAKGIARRAESEDRRLIEREDRVEAELEQLLDVTEMAQDLGR